MWKVEATEFEWAKDENGSSYVRYKVITRSRSSDEVKTCWRRYSEFLELRDKIARLYGRSRASLPLPPRRPWRLSKAGLSERQRGLNVFLLIITRSDAIRQSVEFRQFVLAKELS